MDCYTTKRCHLFKSQAPFAICIKALLPQFLGQGLASRLTRVVYSREVSNGFRLYFWHAFLYLISSLAFFALRSRASILGSFWGITTPFGCIIRPSTPPLDDRPARGRFRAICSRRCTLGKEPCCFSFPTLQNTRPIQTTYYQPHCVSKLQR